jgi:hypothetical protein
LSSESADGFSSVGVAVAGAVLSAETKGIEIMNNAANMLPINIFFFVIISFHPPPPVFDE